MKRSILTEICHMFDGGFGTTEKLWWFQMGRRPVDHLKENKPQYFSKWMRYFALGLARSSDCMWVTIIVICSENRGAAMWWVMVQDRSAGILSSDVLLRKRSKYHMRRRSMHSNDVWNVTKMSSTKILPAFKRCTRGLRKLRKNWIKGLKRVPIWSICPDRRKNIVFIWPILFWYIFATDFHEAQC